MSLQVTDGEDLKNVSMLELAERVLKENNQATHFRDIFARIEEIKSYSNEDVTERLAQFYTDMNLDGRFLTVGENMWGLKRWYPVEQIDEVITTEPKKKKKSKKKQAAKKAPEPQPEEVESEGDQTQEYNDDIDELTRDMPKVDDEEGVSIPDASDIGSDDEHVPELGEEDDHEEDDDEHEEHEEDENES